MNNISNPEFMPPEYLEQGISETQLLDLETQKQMSQATDIWSLGIILLEIISGRSIWLSQKCKVCNSEEQIYEGGLLGVSRRDPKKIFELQQKLFSDEEIFNTIISNDILGVSENEDFVDLLSQMLKFDWKNRINPLKALKHKYLI